ncbi:Peroxisomal acyl-coenzyme A oxidase 1 [Venturia inaequalis]|nr:Peroxisomal acyl-coenzyme A oxidase 1 [Venturia inaequalis]
MEYTGSRNLGYLQSVDRRKKIKPEFNCSRDTTLSQYSSPTAKIDLLQWSSSRHPSPTVFSSSSIRQCTPLRTAPDDLLEARDSLDPHLTILPAPSLYSDEHSTSYPCWERLTSNPSQSGTPSSTCTAISNHRKCISKPQSMSSTISSAEFERSDAMDFANDADDERHMPECKSIPRPRRRPKRKYTHLILDDEISSTCTKTTSGITADCIHTSEIIDSGGDTMVPEMIADGSLPKAKEAKMECEILPEGVVYLGHEALSVERAIDVLLDTEADGDGCC